MKKILLVFFVCFFISEITNAQQITINGPAGSGSFGNVTVLSNGNYVVADPFYDDGAVTDVGAVYLYNGLTHTLISSLKGSIANDRVGLNVTALSNGNFIVVSSNWNGFRGAVTWGNGTTGVSGVVSSSNSLVGGSAGDQVGDFSIVTLSNGNYVVRSQTWNGYRGAVTWGSGTAGVSGVVSDLNSLIGSTAEDRVGNFGITVLSNGNYVVVSPNWDNGSAVDAGAITWCNGTTGRTGAVSSSNSLVGSTANDRVGNFGITVLSNGNYVVTSIEWGATDFGAVTWCNGATGRTGAINSSNSLVGSTANDLVGSNGITVLPNDNYLVNSFNWDNGSATNAGAVTWGNGTTGVTGVVSSTNSLVGSSINDQVGFIVVLSNGNYVVRSPNWNGNRGSVTWGSGTTGVSGVVSSSNSLVGTTVDDRVGSEFITTLNNGNYVVRSPLWNNVAVVDAGAVTWCNGTTGRTGAVSSSNSLVGSTANDNVGNGDVTTLSNGNYVVSSPFWNGIRGAVTWGSGTTGISGVVSSSNSLVGSTANDNVGFVTALSNANYVVRSPNWDNGAATNAGAVTWGSGTTGVSGILSTSNSLVGSTTNDRVGNTGITSLSNGNYVVSSSSWNGFRGAVTWGNGTTGVSGVVSSSNSLVGSTANDNIGNNGVTALGNGNYVVRSFNWDNGSTANAGAVTWGNGTTGISGAVSSTNSLVGSTANDFVGNGSITLLSNGNYVVRSQNWDNGAATDAGAVTWGSGTTGVSGILSNSNSLVGSTSNDQIGNSGVVAFSNGNYVVRSQSWDNGAATDAGAVTWGSGTAGVSGVISSSNSLVGGSSGDQVGDNIVFSINEIYVVQSPNWDNGSATNAGAHTLGNPSMGISGTINSCNSVTGSITSGGVSIVSSFNSTYNYLVVGLRNENKVVIYNPAGQALANHLDVVSTSINGNNAVPFVTNPSCRIIGTLTPNGANPVSGVVNAQAWIESSVPNVAGQPFVARHYEITPATNPATATGRVTLYFTQQEFTDFNNDPGSILDLPTGAADAAGKANLRIEKRNGTSSNGTGLPTTYSGSISTIDPADADIVWNATLSRWEVSFDVTGFSGFFVKTTPSVLPLTLLEFSGRLQNGDALLNWKTENEVNTDQFLVERSTDGRNFTTVGTVDARNQPGANLYNYTDAGVNTLAASMVYYRLKQTDIDSRFTYSRIIALPLGKQSNLMLYPNPATDQLMITLSAERAEKVQVRIIDNAGRIVRQQLWNITAGSATMQVEISSLAKGMYYLEVRGETTDQRKTFIRQ